MRSMADVPLSTRATNSSPTQDETILYKLSFSGASLRLTAISYLALFILLPLAVITVEGFRNGLEAFFTSITRPVALSAIGLTLWTAAVMAVINTIMGTLTAYVLVSYKFPGKA